MTLKDIIAIKGKGELFRVISKSPKGIIVETLNESKLKFKVEPNLQVMVLNDITIYAKDSEDIYLHQLFSRYYKTHGLNPPVDNTSDSNDVVEMFRKLAPNYDDERVYLSDMKKFFKWYKILALYLPAILENLDVEEEVMKDHPQHEIEGTDTSQEVKNESLDHGDETETPKIKSSAKNQNFSKDAE